MTETPTGSDETSLTVAQTDQAIDDSDYYNAELSRALELISDQESVNALIAERTGREELLLTQPAEMQVIGWNPPDTLEINNFGSYLEDTGKVLFAERVAGTDLNGEQFLMEFGGRGIDSYDFAKQKGLGISISGPLFMSTHVSREAFLRMYMLFPDLTKKAINDCKPGIVGDNIRVSYEIMSRLVDIKDSLVTKNGVADPGYLTR